MKIFVSDWHINDGTTYDDFAYRGRPFDDLLGQFLNLMKEKHELAREKGLDNQKLTLVLLGDIFDLFRTERYGQECIIIMGIQNKKQRVNAISTLLFDMGLEKQIAEEVIKEGLSIYQRSFAHLKKFIQSTKAQVVYIEGNHDYPVAHDRALQTLLSKSLGTKIEFKKYLFENGIYAEHGHQYELFNKPRFLNKRRVVCGDGIVKFIINAFASKYKGVLEDLQRAGDIDNVRPLAVISGWLESLPVSRNGKRIKKEMKNAWARNLDDYLETDFFKTWVEETKSGLTGHLLAGLAGRLKVSGTFLDFFSNVFQIKQDRTDHYRDVAKNILDGRYGKISKAPAWFKGAKITPPPNIVLMGHTHEPKYEVFIQNKQKKFYINTGTWRKIIEPEPSEGRWPKDFYSFAIITYAIIYEKDGKHEIELWDGRLL